MAISPYKCFHQSDTPLKKGVCFIGRISAFDRKIFRIVDTFLFLFVYSTNPAFVLIDGDCPVAIIGM